MTSNSGSVWENPVRVMLREGKPVVGVTITTNCVEVAVQTASLGFDFLWIEMEHSPVNPETLRNVVLGTRGLTAIPFARVPVNELWTAKRVMDAGVMGVIFPFTSTPDLARQAATACKYPPLGRRGSGTGLASFRWPSPEDYYDFADRNMMVIAMIEEITAVEQIDAIAATPGIDVLFVGASDISFSMGCAAGKMIPVLMKLFPGLSPPENATKSFSAAPHEPRSTQEIHGPGIPSFPGGERGRIAGRRRAPVSGTARQARRPSRRSSALLRFRKSNTSWFEFTCLKTALVRHSFAAKRLPPIPVPTNGMLSGCYGASRCLITRTAKPSFRFSLFFAEVWV